MSSTVSVGIDVSQAVYGTGVSDYTRDLVAGLLRQDSGISYKFFGSSLRRTGFLKQLFPTAHTIPVPPVLLDLLWNRLHIIPVETFTGRVDVFHSSDWTQPPASARKVTTVHDLSPFLFPAEMAGTRFRNIVRTHTERMKWVLKECDRIICVSRATAQDLQAHFSVVEKKVVVIPEALPSRFLLTPGRSPYSDYIVTIGTAQPRKNLPRLISGYLEHRSRLQLPGKLVVIGGSGWGNMQLPVHPDIIYTGYLSDQDLVTVLAGAKAFAFPSLHEGFGLPILIAFHYGVPVVTSSVSSMPEVAGNAAELVDPLDPASIAEGIAKAVKSAPRLIKAGRNQAEKFSWDETARLTAQVYKSLV